MYAYENAERVREHYANALQVTHAEGRAYENAERVVARLFECGSASVCAG